MSAARTPLRCLLHGLHGLQYGFALRSWAFATATMLEWGHYNATGELVMLSPKQLVDCDTSASGCDGGW
jgi:hypothetical protein